MAAAAKPVPSLLRMDAQVTVLKGAVGAGSNKAGLTAAAADAAVILDAIRAPQPVDGRGGFLRVSSTPATKTDVVALQVRGAPWRAAPPRVPHRR